LRGLGGECFLPEEKKRKKKKVESSRKRRKKKVFQRGGKKNLLRKGEGVFGGPEWDAGEKKDMLSVNC